MNSSFHIASFYRFFSFPEYETWQSPLLALMQKQRMTGTILLADEGINATVAGLPEGMHQLYEKIRSHPELTDLATKEHTASTNPFYRAKVRLKKEIVSLGCEEVDPLACVGTYVEPEAWHELLQDPDTLVIDTRNEYEYELGTFPGAINPHTHHFRAFSQFVESNLPQQKDRKIAMFCTGGIRCEKATSLLLHRGYQEVYHLKGGILNYLEKIPPERSLWQGECFVFDQRVSVNHHLLPGSFEICPACRMPIGENTKTSPLYEPGVSCPRCYHEKSEEDRRRFAERQHQIELARKRGQPHIGSA